jgi:hypothetical protein
VVGDGDGRHAEILGFLDEGVDLVGPVEETVLGVNVEVDELGRHAAFLIFPASLVNAGSFYRRSWGKSILVRRLVLVPFEILHALVELFVGEVNEGACFAELFLDGLVPNAFSFDMGGQAFG